MLYLSYLLGDHSLQGGGMYTWEYQWRFRDWMRFCETATLLCDMSTGLVFEQTL